MRTTSLLLILAACMIAGCGSGSSKASHPHPGTYGGSTSQGMPLSLTVASNGKSLSDLSVQASYTCPAGATERDGAASGPSGAVPLTGNSFAGSFTAHGATYRLAGSYSAGAFTGTLSASQPALSGGTCTSGNVSWHAAPGAPHPAATSTPTTGTTTASPSSARQQLGSAASAYNSGAATFNTRSKTDSATGNLQAFKSDLAQFRAVLAQFDTAVSQISFPAAEQASVSALTLADQAEIADLDAGGSATTAQAAIASYRRAVTDNQNVISAEQALYNAL